MSQWGRQIGPLALVGWADLVNWSTLLTSPLLPASGAPLSSQSPPPAAWPPSAEPGSHGHAGDARGWVSGPSLFSSSIPAREISSTLTPYNLPQGCLSDESPGLTHVAIPRPLHTGNCCSLDLVLFQHLTITYS